ncbi:MAG TPA: urea ABC transporter permease subunit UrtB [Alphaproteobacteria bacterium]|nr:urea ABC transporter permease subunit UrtB [Alphaproteobacteria bacterium]
MRRTWLALLFAVALLVAASERSGARADAFSDTVATMASDGFAARIAAVEALGDLGDPRGVAVLRALNDGNLYVRKTDGRVVIARAGVAIDAITGGSVGTIEAADEAVRLNNRLRGAIRGALGRLMIFSPEPEERLAAAIGVYKTRSVDNLPLLEKALAAETDRRVRAQLQISLAATQILSLERSHRLAGIATLAQSSDTEARAILLQLAAASDIDAELRQAAAAAIAAVDSRLAALRLVQTVFQGLSLGSVLLLAAMGLAITFGVMGVINMAHGEMVMIGAYTTFVIQQTVLAAAPDAADYSLFLAIPAAFVVAGALGVALERGAIRHLYGRPLETLLMTWGLSMILQQAVRSIFGPTNREVATPSFMTGAIEIAGGVTITQNRIWIIVFGLIVLAAVMLIIRYTEFGLQMRAVTQNRRMAAAMGIATGRIDALTFGLGSGIAGLGGVALSQIDNVSPNLGQSYIVDSFMVVVFGGVGNLWGTLLGSALLGVINKFLEPYAGAVLGKILVLVAIILFIQRRPRGLFALRGRAVEA